MVEKYRCPILLELGQLGAKGLRGQMAGDIGQFLQLVGKAGLQQQRLEVGGAIDNLPQGLGRAGIAADCKRASLVGNDKAAGFDRMAYRNRPDFILSDSEAAPRAKWLEANHRIACVRDASEVRPQRVVEHIGSQDPSALLRGMDSHRTTASADHQIREQGQVFDVIEMTVGEQNVVKLRKLLEREGRGQRSRVKREAVVDQKASGPIIGQLATVATQDLHSHSEIPELPFHFEILQIILQPRRVSHRYPIRTPLDQPRPFQMAQDPANTGFTDSDMGRLFSRGEGDFNTLLGRPPVALADLQQPMDHPAVRIHQQKILDLLGCITEPFRQALDHPKRDLGVATNHPLESLGIDHQELGILGHYRRGAAWLIRDDLHPARLKHENLFARLSVNEDHGPLRVLLAISLEKGFLGAHLGTIPWRVAPHSVRQSSQRSIVTTQPRNPDEFANSTTLTHWVEALAAALGAARDSARTRNRRATLAAPAEKPAPPPPALRWRGRRRPARNLRSPCDRLRRAYPDYEARRSVPAPAFRAPVHDRAYGPLPGSGSSDRSIQRSKCWSDSPY